MENLTKTEEKNIGAYEISFIQKSEENKTVADLLKSFGGEIIDERQMMKIRSAYPIKKEKFGFLGVIRFSMGRDAVNRFISSLKLNNDILRSMVGNVGVGEKEFIEKPQTGFRGRAQSKRSVVRRRYVDSQATPVLSNEALEKKIEEILQ